MSDTVTNPTNLQTVANAIITSKIMVTFQRAGLHRYPLAPEDVAYLSSVHRHLFKFKVTIQVWHDDREIEFHQFLNWLESLYGSQLALDYKSCEMLARELVGVITSSYPGRFTAVEVWEDGECGSVVEFTPT